MSSIFRTGTRLEQLQCIDNTLLDMHGWIQKAIDAEKQFGAYDDRNVQDVLYTATLIQDWCREILPEAIKP